MGFPYGGIHGEAKRSQELQAVIPIFDAVREIDAIRKSPRPRLQNVGGRRPPVGLQSSFALVVQQSGFLPSLCDRDAELPIDAEPQGHAGLRDPRLSESSILAADSTKFKNASNAYLTQKMTA